MTAFMVGVFTMSSLTWNACSGSRESSSESTTTPPPPSATEVLQRQLIDLRIENDSLRTQNSKLQESNKSLLAHSAELEATLADLKGKTAPPPPMARPPKTTEKPSAVSYETSLMLFRSRQYKEAAADFQAILTNGNAGRLESNCHYWLGECAYGMKHYKDAIDFFETVFGYAKTTKKDDAQIMIGNCYRALGNKNQAKIEYEKLLAKFPASPYAKTAKAKLAKL